MAVRSHDVETVSRESVDGVAKGQPRWVQEKKAQAGDVLDGTSQGRRGALEMVIVRPPDASERSRHWQAKKHRGPGAAFGWFVA